MALNHFLCVVSASSDSAEYSLVLQRSHKEETIVLQCCIRDFVKCRPKVYY